MITFGVDARVWEAVVGRKPVTPALVALAASQCSLLLPDDAGSGSSDMRCSIFDSLAETEGSSLARECHEDFAKAEIRRALCEWIMSFDDVDVPLRALVGWDHRLGVWCSLVIAETVLKFLPTDCRLPELAVRTARQWVFGNVAVDECKRVRGLWAGDWPSDYNESAAWSAYATVWLAERRRATWVLDPNISSPAAAACAAVASESFAFGESGWVQMNSEERKRLCSVLAQALVDYPTDVMV